MKIMFRAVTLALILVLSGCASISTMVRKPTDCAYETGRFNDGFRKDVVTGVAKAVTRNYICVESPEVVRLPSYIQLLELPPAKEQPVVAVYNFQDLTGQRKAREGIADFSTAVTQGATAMVIDALKTVVEEHGLES